MRKKVISLLMGVTVLVCSSLLVTQKANGFVGIFIKQSTIKSLGEICAETSFYGSITGITTSSILSTTHVSTAIPTFLMKVGLISVIGLAVSVVILDYEKTIDIEFKEINENDLNFKNYSEYEVLIFNSEVDELNAIKRTIELEIEYRGDSVLEKQSLWQNYSQDLSPETKKIAKDIATNLLRKLLK